MQPTATTEISIPADSLELTRPVIDYQDDCGWIPWAWAVLARADEVPATMTEEHADYPAHLISLAALGHLFKLFQEIAAGGDAGLEPNADLVGDVRPEVTTIEIARYCEREGIYDRQEPETGAGLAREAIRSRTSQLQHRLLELLGGGRLFTSLYVTGGHTSEVDDIEEEARTGPTMTDDAFDSYLDSVVNEDLTPDKQRTYAWLEGDLDLG